MGDVESAHRYWHEGLEISWWVISRSELDYDLDTHASLLLLLDRTEEARPIVERLIDRGWDDPDFVELVREKGLG